MFNHDEDNFERIEAISYDDFFREYLQKNKLCVFSSEITKKWRSRSEWVSGGKPDYDYLDNHFGRSEVPVANCNKRYFSCQAKQEMTLSEFIPSLKNTSHDKGSKESLYLKDWHFCKAFPSYNAYDVPIYFTSDWLNEYWDQCSDVSDDYRFVYIGPKGSWTPFHADVFRSYSWSANICGCKKWILFPPGQENYLQDIHGNLIYDITSNEINNQNQYPLIKKAQKPITIIQREGEVIFVPSGWHHQVHNLENTISINHNWTNACGLTKMWQHLQCELTKVQESIQDCNEMENWHNHCQLMLKAISGMDYKDFVCFLTIIANPRIEFLQQSLSSKTATESVFYKWLDSMPSKQCKVQYCQYDLNAIYKCALAMKLDTNFIKIEDKALDMQLGNLISKLETLEFLN